MNVDQLNKNIIIIKFSVFYKKNVDERIEHIWKKRIKFMQGKHFWKISNNIIKEDKPMTSFPKTAYRRTLVPNDEIVEKTTNPYLKIYVSYLLQNMKHSLFWLNILFQYASVSLWSNNLQKDQQVCEWNIQA